MFRLIGLAVGLFADDGASGTPITGWIPVRSLRGLDHERIARRSCPSSGISEDQAPGPVRDHLLVALQLEMDGIFRIDRQILPRHADYPPP